MSVNIILPTLSAWAASRLTGILESKTQDDFNVAFDATFAVECNITVNGESLSRDKYKAQLLQESAAGFEESNAVVNIVGQTEVETGNQGRLVRTLTLLRRVISLSKALNSLDWLEFSTRRSPTPSFSFSVRLRKVGRTLLSISCKHSMRALFLG